MISTKELLGQTLISDVPIEHQHNLEELKRRVNVIREKWAKAMTISSGYRSMFDHKRIYSEINQKRKKQGLEELRIPMASKHLFGQACDVSDPKGELQKWIKDNVQVLEEVGLWCEDFSATPTWVHFQTVQPKSGKRFFLP